jgi:hypothetical protein
MPRRGCDAPRTRCDQVGVGRDAEPRDSAAGEHNASMMGLTAPVPGPSWAIADGRTGVGGGAPRAAPSCDIRDEPSDAELHRSLARTLIVV